MHQLHVLCPTIRLHELRGSPRPATALRVRFPRPRRPVTGQTAAVLAACLLLLAAQAGIADIRAERPCEAPAPAQVASGSIGGGPAGREELRAGCAVGGAASARR